MTHSRLAGDSVYPVVEGNILRLNKTRSLHNPRIGATCEHEIYFWIMKIKTGRTNKGKLAIPKDRPVMYLSMAVPILKGQRFKALEPERRNVQKETLTTAIRKAGGCTIIAEDVLYHATKSCWQRFYNRLNLEG